MLSFSAPVNPVVPLTLPLEQGVPLKRRSAPGWARRSPHDAPLRPARQGDHPQYRRANPDSRFEFVAKKQPSRKAEADFPILACTSALLFLKVWPRVDYFITARFCHPYLKANRGRFAHDPNLLTSDNSLSAGHTGVRQVAVMAGESRFRRDGDGPKHLPVIARRRRHLRHSSRCHCFHCEFIWAVWREYKPHCGRPVLAGLDFRVKGRINR